MTSDEVPDPLDAAARFVARQAGGIEAVLARHVRRVDGGCAGCTGHHFVRWPCVMVDIARRAKGIDPA
jgi:hypothetical protein